MTRVIDFFRSFLLLELLRGMMLTGRHLFARNPFPARSVAPVMAAALRHPTTRVPDYLQEC